MSFYFVILLIKLHCFSHWLLPLPQLPQPISCSNQSHVCSYLFRTVTLDTVFYEQVEIFNLLVRLLYHVVLEDHGIELC